ncbi:MAG: PD40 domain-containing protein [Verrucomicrobia bacterium]|nr:PD40 domain-containing protein [Verrucomicrobiota bacterium]
MKLSLTWKRSAAAAVAIALAHSPASAQTAESLTVIKTYDATKLTPIAISDFTGEVASVLKFDLEVAGFTNVSPDKALFFVSGSANDQLKGFLTDRNKASLLAKAYTGAPQRSLAHTFADDIVLTITGKKGIARTRIAFVVGSGENSEIYVADYDGHNAKQVTSDKTITAAPCLARNGASLFYTSYLLNHPDIFSIDLTTGKRTAVARHPGLNTSAAVSPDGQRVAMILSKNGSPDVYVANADGTGLLQLTKTREDESSPCWSPDGRWICFATKIDGRRTLAKVPASGGAMQRVATSGVPSPSEPDWSPDGKTIVFTAQTGSFNLCTVPAEGGEATVLVSGEDPSWAPNSRTVIFTRRSSEGKRGLALLDMPTKTVKNIPQVLGNNSQPSWAK